MIRYAAQSHAVFLLVCGYLHKSRAERQHLNLQLRAVVVAAQIVYIRMVQTRLHLPSAVLQSRLAVESYAVCLCLPRQVAQSDELRPAVASRHGSLSVASFRQLYSPGEYVAIVAVQIVNVCQIRKLVVSQQPWVGVYLRRENQSAVERLQYEVVLPVVKT